MDINGILKKMLELIKKYRYAVLILIIGLVMMAVPSTKDDTPKNDPATTESSTSEPTLEEKLADILSQVDGAGEVRVILTVAAGEETVYQTNDDISATSDSSSTNSDTVTVTDADRNQNGLIRQINPAVYQGAIIVCKGAGDPSVHLAIVDAVSKLTGLGANRISVLKMK